MRKPSDATLLRQVRRSLSETKGALELCKIQREQYLGRAVKAEQEVAEWKRRFDDLLRLRPGVQAVPVPSALDDRLRSLLKGDLYIDAIKTARNETGVGLKEAKDYVDALKQKAAT